MTDKVKEDDTGRGHIDHGDYHGYGWPLGPENENENEKLITDHHTEIGILRNEIFSLLGRVSKLEKKVEEMSTVNIPSVWYDTDQPDTEITSTSSTVQVVTINTIDSQNKEKE